MTSINKLALVNINTRMYKYKLFYTLAFSDDEDDLFLATTISQNL